jgi:hypothetical protein
MEKVPKDSQGMPPDTSGDVGDVKLGGPSVDTALGQMLEVESSPQLERKVLWKIDLM